MDNSPKGVLTSDRECLPAWHMGVLLPDPRAVKPDKDARNDPNFVNHVRSMSELKCAPSSTAGDGKKTGCVPPTHSWFRYCPSSLTDLPPVVRDVGNDGLCFRFLVSSAGRSHAFPASRSTNGRSVVLSLSLSLSLF